MALSANAPNPRMHLTVNGALRAPSPSGDACRWAEWRLQ